MWTHPLVKQFTHFPAAFHPLHPLSTHFIHSLSTHFFVQAPENRVRKVGEAFFDWNSTGIRLLRLEFDCALAGIRLKQGEKWVTS